MAPQTPHLKSHFLSSQWCLLYHILFQFVNKIVTIAVRSNVASVAQMSGTASGILSPPGITLSRMSLRSCGLLAVTIRKTPHSPHLNGKSENQSSRVTIFAPRIKQRAKKISRRIKAMALVGGIS
jgi:hypothetical protein